jgi:gamma-glutamyltranspeptidase/glutathione hydrolase
LIDPDRAAGVVHAGDPFLFQNDQSFPLRPQPT